jgi:molybdopterin-guanine dinucleotide biosynthesis protein A
MAAREIGGLLLTGGRSSRMGQDKATITIDGVTLADRTAELLRAATTLALEVGPGVSALTAVEEQPPGQGPLAAILAGRHQLLELGLGPGAPCLVVACDLPALSEAVLRRLREADGDVSILPVIDGVEQPLCARWSAADLDAAVTAFADGERSLRRLPNRRAALLLDEAEWGSESASLRDADTPEDLAAIGITLEARSAGRAAVSRGRPRTPGRR